MHFIILSKIQIEWVGTNHTYVVFTFLALQVVQEMRRTLVSTRPVDTVRIE